MASHPSRCYVLVSFLTAGLGLLGLAATTLSWPASSTAAEDQPAAHLRHIVLFKFKPEATKQQIAEVVAAFGQLPKKIDAISGYEWGTDISTEMKSEGYTHCFVVTFPDTKARDKYLPHPAHAEFVKLVGPVVEKVLVVDFLSGK